MSKTTPTKFAPTMSQPRRRQVLQWAFGLGAGSLALAGCGGGDGDSPPSPVITKDTLPDPPVIRARDGRIDLSLHARYATQNLRVARTTVAAYPGAANEVEATLRSFNGQSVAPTLELSLGDVLRVRLINELPVNTRQSSLEALNYQNSTNLHFHGMHVDPREIRPGVFGDYVVDTADAGVRPGQERLHEVRIPDNHTSGVNWYHPHLHGSTTVQVASGMFGAILVRHPDDHFATAARERVMFVHKTFVDPTTRIDGLNDAMSTDASDFLVNGTYQPTLVMRPGEVQKWHFINADIFFPFSPVLDEHTLWAYARDGNVYQGRFRALSAETAGKPDNQHWPGNDIFPGARHSIVVQASQQSGTFLLRNYNPQTGREEVVARVVVEGEPVGATLPTPADLPVFSEAYAPITDEELARAGGRQRHLVLAIVPKDSSLLAPRPAGEIWTAPPEDGTRALEGSVFATGVDPAALQLAPFQSVLTPVQTVAFDAVEEWTLYNPNTYAHPFHIHINDSYVVRVNGEDVTPFWADTLPVPTGSTKPLRFGSLTFRMRFADFRGKFVWHCHALDHEDLGMMQLVEIV